MAEYVSLDQESESIEIAPVNLTSLQNINNETVIIDGIIDTKDYPTIPDSGVIVSVDQVIKEITSSLDNASTIALIDKLENDYPSEDTEDHICLKDEFDASRYYGDSDPNHYFKKENLFSELTDEYERTIARLNLGIGEAFAMKWGNITGNLSNQKDLYNFTKDLIAESINQVINEINLKLVQWAVEINNSLTTKAPINSPEFTGEPTVLTPLADDDSKRIANTEWVNARIAESTWQALKNMSLSQTYMYYGDPAVNVICYWSYATNIESQSINEEIISVNTRSYAFQNVNTSFSAVLRYLVDGKEYSRTLSFTKYYPVYYGIKSSYAELTKTKETFVDINCGTSDYAYIYIPNNPNVRFTVDGFVGGFSLINTISLHGTTYYLYRSTYPGLGNLHINLS